MKEKIETVEAAYVLVFGNKPVRSDYKCSDKEYVALLRASISMNVPVENINELILPQKINCILRANKKKICKINAVDDDKLTVNINSTKVERS